MRTAFLEEKISWTISDFDIVDTALDNDTKPTTESLSFAFQ
jgi:hypothetical protein